MQAKISVVIPLYNKASIIERTVKSVLHQTFSDFELVIVNDGSTDGSLEIVKNIPDDRIVIINQTNGGPSKARNTGTKAAKADWIVFLDADDELMPDALEHFWMLQSKYREADIYNCKRYIRSKNGMTPTNLTQDGYVKNNMKECYYGRCMPGEGASMYQKQVLLSFPYDEIIRRFEDAELLIRMLPHVKVYSDSHIAHIVNTNFSEASHPRKDINEDYAGHLSMKGKGFWARMCVYRTYLENRELYPVEMRKLYPTWYYRYDFLLLLKIFNWFR